MTRTLLRRLVLPGAILAYACALRVVFFSGFVLCDDVQELSTVLHISAHGPILTDQFHLRFGVWLFNVLAFRLFGVSEASFFLPTVLMSGSFAVLGYAVLLRWGYRVGHAVAAAVMIASAPFEILVGTLRANDVILAWLIGGGLLALVALGRWPVLQGLLLAVLLWIAFYTKLWVVYLLPALGVYYLRVGWRRGVWRGAVTLGVASIVLHGATCLFWKSRTGSLLPFIETHAATYPIPRADLPELFRVYPTMLFRGSEFESTLFGSVPYLLGVGLALKLAGTLLGRRYRLDARDWALLGMYGSFFLLLEFFPNNFAFDRYYSAPRIFRYLTPLSFPVTLHVAKMVLDLAPPSRPRIATWLPLACLVALSALNLAQAREATGPTLVYRTKLMAALRDVREMRPPRLVAEWWVSFFLANVYLKDLSGTVQVVPIYNTYTAKQYEAWLTRYQSTLPPRSLLLTGLASCVHYGAHQDGFRLARFQHPLDPAWKLVRDYGPITYLPVVESARLWQLAEPVAAAATASVETGQGPDALFATAMASFDRGDCAGATPYYRAIIERFPGSEAAPNAWYFESICRLREGDPERTLSGLQELVRRFPSSIWVPGAYYHMGVAYAALGDVARARETFAYVRDTFARDPTVVRLAEERLVEMGTERQPGLLSRLWTRLRAVLTSS